MKIGQLGNIQIKDNNALISINPKLYSMSAVFSAMYLLCDKAFIMVDGNPTEEVLIDIAAKEGNEIIPIVEEFNKELNSYVVYEMGDDRDKELKKIVMQKLLLTNKYEDIAPKVRIVDKKKLSETIAEDEEDTGELTE